MKQKLWDELRKGVLFGVSFAVLLVFVVFPGQAQQTTVSLSVPELVKGNTVYATVNIGNVENLDAGQFDILFNPDALKVVSVDNGSIGEKAIPVKWKAVDSKTVRVVFNLEGITGVSGSGQLAKIGLEIIGDGKSDLQISDGLLGNTNAQSIDTSWGGSKEGGDNGKGAATQQRASSGFGIVLSLVVLTAVVCLFSIKQRL
jgi:hypothetical protein